MVSTVREPVRNDCARGQARVSAEWVEEEEEEQEEADASRADHSEWTGWELVAGIKTAYCVVP